MALSPVIAARLAALRVQQQEERGTENGTQKHVQGNLEEAAVGGCGEQVARTTANSEAAQLLQGAQQSSSGNPQPQESVSALKIGTSLTGAELIQARISELKSALQTAIPGYERMLQVIHRALAEDEEIVHILSEEEIGIICAGLAKRKNVVLVTTAASNKGEKQRLSKLSVDDI